MERVTKERKTTYSVYVACDGTEFETEKECSDYENSAKAELIVSTDFKQRGKVHY